MKYAEQLEAWEESAYDGGFGADWFEEVGENVKFYALQCEEFGEPPTFEGLMRHLASIAEEGDGKRGQLECSREINALISK